MAVVGPSRFFDGVGYGKSYAALQRTKKIHRLHDWEKSRLVILHIPRDKTIRLALHGRDHLDGIFEIAVIEIERLLEGVLINRCDFDNCSRLVIVARASAEDLPFWTR